MKTLLTPTQLIAVELPENSNRIIKGLNECHLAFYDVESFTVYNIGLDFSILGIVDKGAIYFYCEEIMLEFKQDDSIGLTDFTDDSIILFCGEQSFISLLKSHSLSLDKKYLIIKPKN